MCLWLHAVFSQVRVCVNARTIIIKNAFITVKVPYAALGSNTIAPAHISFSSSRVVTADLFSMYNFAI